MCTCPLHQKQLLPPRHRSTEKITPPPTKLQSMVTAGDQGASLIWSMSAYCKTKLQDIHTSTLHWIHVYHKTHCRTSTSSSIHDYHKTQVRTGASTMFNKCLQQEIEVHPWHKQWQLLQDRCTWKQNNSRAAVKYCSNTKQSPSEGTCKESPKASGKNHKQNCRTTLTAAATNIITTTSTQVDQQNKNKWWKC